MTVTGKIVDIETQEPIPYTSIVLVDGRNDPTTVGVMADSNGQFSISDSRLQSGGSYNLQISSVGYETIIVDPTAFISTPTYGLQKEATDLAPIYITPNSGHSSSTGWIIAGIILLFLISNGKNA